MTATAMLRQPAETLTARKVAALCWKRMIPRATRGKIKCLAKETC
jgi:hypothetical protein